MTAKKNDLDFILVGSQKNFKVLVAENADGSYQAKVTSSGVEFNIRSITVHDLNLMLRSLRNGMTSIDYSTIDKP